MAVTVQELNTLIESIHKKEAEADVVKKQLAELNKEAERLRMQGAAFLNELNQTEFVSPHGKFELISRVSVGLPKTDEDKAVFFEWLREKEIFERYATVNSRALQGLYKNEREQAIKEGEDPLTWTIPGLPAPKISQTTKLGKGKKTNDDNESDDSNND